DLDESDVTDHAVRGEAQLPVGLGAHHEPDLGHGRVLLGVQVACDGFGLDAAPHVRRGERWLDPSADPFGYQCLHQGSGCWVARWLECGWCDQLTNGGCCDNPPSGLVPLIAALFQVLVDLEAHLSRLLYQVCGYGVLVPAGDPVALGAAGVDAFSAVHSVLECADVAVGAVAGHSITPIPASSRLRTQSRTPVMMRYATRAANTSRRRAVMVWCSGRSRSRPVEQREHGVGHRVVDGLHVRHRLSARATERDRGVQDHRRQFVAMGEAGLLGRVPESAVDEGRSLPLSYGLTRVGKAAIWFLWIALLRRFPGSGAQVVGGHESVPSIAARRFSIRSSTTTAGKHSPSSRDTTGRHSFATSTRYCTRSRVAAYASRDSRA